MADHEIWQLGYPGFWNVLEGLKEDEFDKVELPECIEREFSKIFGGQGNNPNWHPIPGELSGYCAHLTPTGGIILVYKTDELDRFHATWEAFLIDRDRRYSTAVESRRYSAAYSAMRMAWSEGWKCGWHMTWSSDYNKGFQEGHEERKRRRKLEPSRVA